MNKYKWKNTIGYKEFYSSVALSLAMWSLEIGNKNKSLKVKRIADKIEKRKRKYIDSSFDIPVSIEPELCLARISTALEK